MLSPGSFPTSWPASRPSSLTVTSGSLALPLTRLQGEIARLGSHWSSSSKTVL